MKADYFGNCIESFDEDGESLIPIFDNVSDFALIVEQSEEISLKEFIRLTSYKINDIDDFKSKHNTYLYNKDRKSALIYNTEEDIHFIFKINNEEITMTKTPLEKIEEIENFIQKSKENGHTILFHSGEKSLNKELEYGIVPQFGNWLIDVLSNATDDEEHAEEIKENEHNQTCFFSETPEWVSIKAQKAMKIDGSLSEVTIQGIIDYGQLCIVLAEHDEFAREEEFKRAGTREDDCVEKSTYLFSSKYADYELPFGVEKGDIYSHQTIIPEYTLTGLELIGFLARNHPEANRIKENIQDIFKEHPEFNNTENKLENFIKNKTSNTDSKNINSNSVKRLKPRV